MLYLFYGNDTVNVRRQAFDFMHTKEDQGVRTHRIESEEYAPRMFADMLGAVSLFGETELYCIDTPSQNKDMYTEVIDNLDAFAESTNVFIIIENALLAPEKKKFAKYAAEVTEVKADKAERFNAFGMADALARKDKKSLWVLLQEAKRAGLTAEEIIGTLWWQLKTLRLVTVTHNAAAAGMKDFTYNKAKRSVSQFKAGEVETLSRNLLTVYHDGHGGVRDIDLSLEEWVLKM